MSNAKPGPSPVVPTWWSVPDEQPNKSPNRDAYTIQSLVGRGGFPSAG